MDVLLFRGQDAPQLGLEFDTTPSGESGLFNDQRKYSVDKENRRVSKRIKVTKTVSDFKADENNSCPVRKYGAGKNLFTLWQVSNRGFNFLDRPTIGVSHISTSKSRKTPSHKKSQQKKPVRRKLTKKTSVKKGEVRCNKNTSQTKICDIKCDLALAGEKYLQHNDQSSGLVDDEELELRELQGGPNPLSCSAHFSTNGWHCCSLCKDLLSKFPGDSVVMRQPFSIQPWDSSPRLVKKLFKVFHFLYTYAILLDICPFTLDEFVKAFHDKESLLLGKIHIALLKFLLFSVEMELSNGCVSRASKNLLFLGLVHSVECQESIVKLWKDFLDPLTWTEIMRQVLVAAGFGSKEEIRTHLSKEVDFMVKYELRPGTLKCALFNILSQHDNNGKSVSDLANSFQILEFNLCGTTEEVEHLISSTLASDVTLFERISLSTFRVRINSGTDAAEGFESDNEDPGNVVDDSRNIVASSSDSDCDSLTADIRMDKQGSLSKKGNKISVLQTEIDESCPEKVWLLGLMEGEYTDLCIEEKLDVLLALVDLLNSASSITTESPLIDNRDRPNIHSVGSGAKINRSSLKEHNRLRQSWDPVLSTSLPIRGASSENCPIDSSVSLFNIRLRDNNLELEVNSHPMQSIFLGSDRRYNRYWIFLGPCNPCDPGHRRVYYESSEDGHWEVIDNQQAFCSLMSALDSRGRRESLLLASLEKRETVLCHAMSSRISNDAGNNRSMQAYHSEIDLDREDNSSPVSSVDNITCLNEITTDSTRLSGAIFHNAADSKREEESQKWSCRQAFDAWVWNSFYCNLNAVKHCKKSYLDSLMRCESCHDLYWRDEKHCKICHLTFELDFDLEEKYIIHVATCRGRECINTFPMHKVLPSQLQSLKAAIHAIESFMPDDALIGAWTKSAHKLWIKRLRRTSSLPELLQVVADFVGAMRKEWVCESKDGFGSGIITLQGIIISFHTLPRTSSALALWLVKLDTLIDRIAPPQKTPQCGIISKGKRARSNAM